MLWRKGSASRRRSAYAAFYVAGSTRFVERCGVTCARGAHACPAETWGVRGEGQAEAVRSREDEVVGVVRGGSLLGIRARVPEPAGGVVQSGDGGVEKGLVPLGERLQGGERTGGEVSGCDA